MEQDVVFKIGITPEILGIVIARGTLNPEESENE